MDQDYYRDLTRYQFEGKRLILSGAPLAAFTTALASFRELGATDFFILASGIGSGDLPSEDEAGWIVMDTASDSMMGSFRIMERELHNPSPEIVQRLDEWDPDRSAVMLSSPFFYQESIAGRRVYGWRRREWLDLEDKVVADEIWDASAVDRAPSEVVPVDHDAIRKSVRSLDRGHGAVLAGDAREGFNGGAEYIRWVRGDDDLADPLEFFGMHCDRVRVMPFLEGIPCSIHGYVFPEATAVLRPCELITLRRPDRTLKYCGAASYWDPDDRDRRAMRAAARRVGEHLRHRVDYRGAFTIDGVMTGSEGFLPTELNTRPGAALRTLVSGLPRLGLGAINRALIEGEDLDYRPLDFENLIIAAADDHRGGGGWTVVDRPSDTNRAERVARSPAGSLKVAAQDDEAVASLSFGPGEQGGFLRFTPVADYTPSGPSAAPLVAEGFRLADELWEVGLGDLTPAPSVR
jgi:hypothetical protein